MKTKLSSDRFLKILQFIILLIGWSLLLLGFSNMKSPTGTSQQYELVSPYTNGYIYQYKVNLHAHTTKRNENYAYSPRELLIRAKEYGFHAFAITDLPHAGGIVEDPNVDGILHIPGIEYGGKPHLIGLGINSLTSSENKQEQIDHIKNQGGIAYIPHPYWGNYDEKFLGQLKKIDGIAVFNSLTYGVAVYEKKESEVIPFNERVIDSLLTKGQSVAIIAEEDTKYEDPHNYGHQLNTAWISIWGQFSPDEIEVKDVLEAIKNKNFTSHARHLRNHPEPPRFLKITTKGMRIEVKLDKSCEIAFISKGGHVKKTVRNSTRGNYKVSPEDGYIRIRATYREAESSWAWTNPIINKKRE